MLAAVPPAAAQALTEAKAREIIRLFGGLSGDRRIVAATVLERVVLVPLVLVPLAIAGVFPHLLVAFAVLDPVLGIGAWLLLSRSPSGGPRTSLVLPRQNENGGANPAVSA
jgi:hypothetical protein